MDPILDVLRALNFAAQKHTMQRRKDPEASPYINHPISVAHILRVEAEVVDPITLIAAILHDTVEDTKTSFEELEQHFGPEVRAIVQEVTDDKSLAKDVRKRLQVENGPKKSPRAQLVKFADKISNLRDVASSPPASWSLERRREYFDWAKAVIDGMRGRNAKLEQLFDSAFLRRP